MDAFSKFEDAMMANRLAKSYVLRITPKPFTYATHQLMAMIESVARASIFCDCCRA